MTAEQKARDLLARMGIEGPFSSGDLVELANLMPGDRPEPAFIEIVDTRKYDEHSPNILIPNEVRINGVPLAVPQQEAVVLERMEISGMEVLQVTLTLFARRVEMRRDA